MGKKEILEEVERIICHDRNNQYGEPEDVFNDIATFWSEYLDRVITKQDVAIMMTLFKIARIKHQKKLDSFIDAIGYMTIGTSFLTEKLTEDNI